MSNTYENNICEKCGEKKSTIVSIKSNPIDAVPISVCLKCFEWKEQDETSTNNPTA